MWIQNEWNEMNVRNDHIVISWDYNYYRAIFLMQVKEVNSGCGSLFCL